MHDLAVLFLLSAGGGREVSLRVEACRGRRVKVRHKETHCTGAHRNGPTQTGEMVEKTGAKSSGPKQTRNPNTALWTTLSGESLPPSQF